MNPFLTSEPADAPSPWSAAACVGEWETFDAAALGDKYATEAALDMCRNCPLEGDCLDAALTHERTPGAIIWLIAGGLLPNQRAEILGKRPRTAAGR